MDVTCCVLYERAAGFEHSPRTPVPLLGPKLDHWPTLVCIAVHMVSGTVSVLAVCSCPGSSQTWLDVVLKNTCDHHAGTVNVSHYSCWKPVSLI